MSNKLTEAQVRKEYKQFRKDIPGADEVWSDKNRHFYKFEKERMVCDFIAGMTDRYAIKLYNSIK